MHASFSQSKREFSVRLPPLRCAALWVGVILGLNVDPAHATRRPSLLDMAAPPSEALTPSPSPTPAPRSPAVRKRTHFSLASLPINVGQWRVALRSDKSFAGRACVLEHHGLDFDDGEGNSKLYVEIWPDSLRVTTPSPIEPLGGDHHIAVDDADPVFMDYLEPDGGRIYLDKSLLIDQMKAGIHAQIQMSVWPGSNRRADASTTLNLQGFQKATRLLEKCQKASTKI